jgi:hypothetical protein
MANNDKCTAMLPAVRVSPRLEQALMRLAAREDRSLSDYLRLMMERHCFGHAQSVGVACPACPENNAMQSDARN